MRRSSNIGQSEVGHKDSTSVTVGKKLRLISATINGVIYKKVVTNIGDTVIVMPWATEEDAVRHRDYARLDGAASDYALAE